MADASRDLAVNLVGKTDKLNRAFGNIGGSLKGKAKAGLVALGVAAAAAIANAFKDAMAAEDIGARLQASLGLTDAEAAAAGKTASNLYRDAWGDSLDEVSSAVGTMMSSFDGLQGDELETLTAQAIAFSDVFGTDVNEAVTAAGVLLKSGLVDDAQEAFDLLTVGMQEMPAGLRGELLSATEEYSQFFSALGIDGEEAFGLLVQASEDGQFGVDKMGDALKELTIRSTDMSTASVDAYEAAGLSAEDMADRFLAGGDTANQAFDDLIDGLLSIEDPTEQANAAIALFGTPLEDLGTTEIPAFLESLGSMESSLGNVEGAAQEMADTVGGTTSAKLTAFRRKVMGKLADAAVFVIEAFEKWVPKIGAVVGKVVGFFKRFKDPKKLFGDLGSILVDKGAELLRGLRDGALDFWRDTVLPFIKSLPKRAVDGIGALGSILLRKGRDLLGGLRDGIVAVWRERIAPFFSDLPGNARDRLGILGSFLLSKGKVLLGGFRDGIVDVWRDRIGPFFSDLPGNVRNRVGIVGGVLLSKGIGLMAGMMDGVRTIWNDKMGPFFSDLPGNVKNRLGIVGSVLLSKGIALLGGLLDGLNDVWNDVAGFFQDIPGNIAGFFANAGSWLADAGRRIGSGLVNAFLSVIPGPIRSFLGLGGGSGGVPDFGPVAGVNIEGTVGTQLKLHSGGRVPGGPNDELLALLQGGETVRTTQQEKELAAMVGGGGGGDTFNVTVQMPPGSNGDDVVRALRQWERRRGPIPIRTRVA